MKTNDHQKCFPKVLHKNFTLMAKVFFLEPFRLYINTRAASKHSLFSIYYSDKRKSKGKYGLKIKIKVHDLKIISGSILLRNIFLWWYRSFTKGLFTTKILPYGEFRHGLNSTLCVVNPLALFTTKKLKTNLPRGELTPPVLMGWNSHPGANWR